MSVSNKLSALGFAFLILGGGNHAQAGFPTAALSNGGAVSYDGLTFTISNCSFQLNNVGQSSCSSANDSMAIVASNRGTPTVEFLGNGTGTNGSNALSSVTSAGLTDLIFTLTVTQTVANSSAKVTSFSNAITGSPSASSSVSSRAVYSSYSANTTLAAPNASSSTFASPLTSAGGSMAVNVNLGLAAGSATTLTLANDALHFSPAPEPASIVLLGSGITGIAAVRRRFRRRALGA